MLHFRNQFLTTNTYLSSTRPNIGSNYFFLYSLKKWYWLYRLIILIISLIISLFKTVLTSFISEPSAAPLNVRGHQLNQHLGNMGWWFYFCCNSCCVRFCLIHTIESNVCVRGGSRRIYTVWSRGRQRENNNVHLI